MEFDEQEQKEIPPQLIPFQPGQSGNPGGRPRTRLLSKAAREKLGEINPESGLTYAEEIVLAMVKEAKRGNVWAARELRGWTEGKVTPHVLAQIQQNNLITSIGSDEPDALRKKLFDKLLRVEAGTTIPQNDGSTVHEPKRLRPDAERN